jgi:hypothetical protein
MGPGRSDGLDLFQDRYRTGRFVKADDTAAIFGKRNSRHPRLPLTCLSAQLQNKLVDHRQAIGPDRMSLGDQLRAFPTERSYARGDIAAALPLRAKPKHFDLIDFAERRRIVNFGDVDIRRREPSQFVGPIRSNARDTPSSRQGRRRHRRSARAFRLSRTSPSLPGINPEDYQSDCPSWPSRRRSARVTHAWSTHPTR